jgi:hypothetical protein
LIIVGLLLGRLRLLPLPPRLAAIVILDTLVEQAPELCSRQCQPQPVDHAITSYLHDDDAIVIRGRATGKICDAAIARRSCDSRHSAGQVALTS